jgi:microcystin-dependent protein
MPMEALLGEIRIIASETVPEHWLPCDGRILQIRSNPALYSLLGNMYGGDGTSTFALPDLRARVPIHRSYERPQGERAAAAPAQGATAEQQFLAFNFCICADYGVFPPRQ